MRNIPARQVHLDFHTSPLIPGVGSRFDKAEFQKTLKIGNVNSVTIFAKCHHGYCYFPTKVGTTHPTLPEGFDLTGAMMDAAHEIGVAAPVYITAGWSALDAQNHPEWISRDIQGNLLAANLNPNAAPDDARPVTSWYHLCLNGSYTGHILDLTREICDRYPKLDGLFYDIMTQSVACRCAECLKGMTEMGLDPESDEDARKYGTMKHIEFMKKCAEILHTRHPEATIFFNGCADLYNPEFHGLNSHIEMEDLPTCWGGYNKMPPRAGFMQRYGKEYLGMTGKFHTAWGEFGGYKNPEALKYEALLMAMYGAKCSIGDQMPPYGTLDVETYKNIGVAYRALEKIEPWAYPSESTAEIGVYLARNGNADNGLHTMLLEAHLDFGVVMEGDSLEPYKLLILPDCVKISADEAKRIQEYADRGGCVLFGYESAVAEGGFLLDCGAEYLGASDFDVDYLKTGESIRLPFGNAPFVCYRPAKKLALKDGKPLAEVYNPYFSRTYAHYCSHMNTPYTGVPSDSPAIVRKGNVIYYAHPLCSMYRVDGAQLFREAITSLIRQLYSPIYEAALPSAGRTALRYQKHMNRYVFHASYASPVSRGRTEVIEDIVPIYNVPVSVRLDSAPASVKLVPENTEIEAEYADGELKFVIPCVNCHQAVEIQMK